MTDENLKQARFFLLMGLGLMGFAGFAAVESASFAALCYVMGLISLLTGMSLGK